MCEVCRVETSAYYGDDAIWRRAQALYRDNPSLGVLGHVVFEDDNLELHHLLWSRDRLTHVRWMRSSWSGLHGKPTPTMKRSDDLSNYSDAEIQAAIDAHEELIAMAESVFGIDKARERVEASRNA